MKHNQTKSNQTKQVSIVIMAYIIENGLVNQVQIL